MSKIPPKGSDEALEGLRQKDFAEPLELALNTGEQEIRHGVLFRKTSQGTQSNRGSEFVANILTVRATLRKQERNMLDFVIEACRARLNGREPPSLLRPDLSATHPAQTLAKAASLQPESSGSHAADY